jgi:hypothetical protein
MAVTMHSEWTVSWLLPRTRNGLCHGCYHALGMAEWTVPWLLPRTLNGLCHGCYHALRMDCVMVVTTPSEWTVS